MSTHCIFELQGRRYGSGHRTYAKIECGFCHHVEWHVAKDSGIAVRVFRSHGWKVGNKPAQHRCPLCFSKARASRRAPDNPAIPPEVGKQLKEKILNGHLREALLGGSVLTPKGPHAMPRPTDDRSAEAPPIDDTPEQVVIIIAEPPLKPVRGTTSVPGRTMFPTRKAAAAAAVRATGSVDGIAFFTVPFGEGWTYKLTVNTTEAERTQWRADRKYGPRPTKRRPDSPFGPTPVRPVSTRELHGAIPSTPEPVTQPAKDTMSATLSIITPDRQPTRDERSLIHDELTKTYSIVDQRYGGSDSDANVAARLNLPRVFVTDVRTMFFGDHDRNQHTEARKAGLEELVKVAQAAGTRLIEMAAEAESIEQRLKVVLKKLEG